MRSGSGVGTSWPPKMGLPPLEIEGKRQHAREGPWRSEGLIGFVKVPSIVTWQRSVLSDVG